MFIYVIFLLYLWLYKVNFLAAHKALHICVDDQLLYINLYFARCVYTSFTVICSEKSTPSVFYVRIQVLCVVCTYSPIQHTSWVLSVMNCNEFSTLLLLVYMPLMLKHPFCICSHSDWVLFSVNLLLQYFIVCDPFTVALQFLN